MASNRSYRNALPQEVVRAEIEKGKGTQFDPDIADIMLGMIDEDKDYEMKQSQPRHHNILVIDDDSVSISSIKAMLESYRNYSVFSAEGGAEGLKRLEDHDIDLVLLDLVMEDMDGFDVLESIRRDFDVPVVFMTGERDAQTMERANSLGCDDFITKPFHALQIKEIIRSILGDE